MTGRPSRILRLLLVVAALTGTVAGCGGGGDAGTVTAATPAAWEKVVPGGDCECADGSTFSFWERRAAPTKVVLFLDGGGMCFDAATCAFTGLGTGGEAT